MVTRIAHITDIHLDEDFPKENGINSTDNWLYILDSLRNQEIDKIVFTGDIGSKLSNRWFFKTIKDNLPEFRIALGNHDSYTEVSKYFKEKKSESENELYYFEDDTFYRYFFFDTSSDRMSEAQLSWFKRHTDINKDFVIFIHHPIISNASKADKLFALENRDRLDKILKALRKRIFVFCGHYHMDDFTIDENIHQQITIAASYQIEKNEDLIEINNSVFGYRIIELSEKDVCSQIIRLRTDNQ